MRSLACHRGLVAKACPGKSSRLPPWQCLIDVEISVGSEIEIHEAVLGEQRQHVIEETDSGLTPGLACAVEVQSEFDIGFCGAREIEADRFITVLYLSRPRMGCHTHTRGRKCLIPARAQYILQTTTNETILIAGMRIRKCLILPRVRNIPFAATNGTFAIRYPPQAKIVPLP